ncbi:MAG: glutamate--tRNA ligase [Candidatus Azotimanducaceae bacterium]|uniref:Glutamate--tRNA ligase n=1 Tax=OM182 bacterium TaxID=2510334 RepID=A0A520RX50_9GAMM|nr:glutamate--tRNA ligase [Gammaproteobacteria bacterium]RZO74757.1 MAG: glutamate--tRNA ligase [OM182 bacterium]
MNIRTRVAPSPTGDPHVGTAYMALFSLCFARQFGGQFVLRIEDTDAARSSRQSEQNILDSLRWLGLDWDEGPDKSGSYGPYRQSERLDIYKEHIGKLLSRGHAFHCFCTPERLSTMRAEQIKNKQTTRYDGCCLSLSNQEVQEKLASGQDYVVRMKVPEKGTCIVRDRLRGDIPIEYAQIDMQVLQKSDGNPTYHLAVVVDDHLMEITHIIRGEEWINSAPKHMLLYEYFGWHMPELIHMPLLRNPDKSKLSKRKNPTSISFYERMGFLPEAVINYLGMLGWSMPDGEEKFSLKDMVKHFDLERISLGAPIFDVDKLKWLNGRWLREELDDDAFADRISEWAYNRENLKRIIPLVKERVDIFSEITDMIAFFASGLPTLSESDLTMKNLSVDQTKKILQFALWDIDSLDIWDRDSLNKVFETLGEDLELKIRDVLSPIFIAISGKPVSPPLFDSMEIIGVDMTRARLKNAIDVLGGVSKKLTKKLEKEYQLIRSSRE